MLSWACLSHEIIYKSRTQAQNQKFYLIFKRWKTKYKHTIIRDFAFSFSYHGFMAEWKCSTTLVLSLSYVTKIKSHYENEERSGKLRTSMLLTYTFGCVWLVFLLLCAHLFRRHLKWTIRWVCRVFCRKPNAVWNLDKSIIKGIDIQNETKTYKYFQWRRRKDYQKRWKRPNYIQQL